MTTKGTETGMTHSNGHGSSDLGAHALVIVGSAVDRARGVVLRVGASVPPFVTTSRELFETSMRAIERASDERLSAGTTLSLGLAIGMLVGGAPRLLTAAALVPVAAMGMALLDRRSSRVTRSTSPA